MNWVDFFLSVSMIVTNPAETTLVVEFIWNVFDCFFRAVEEWLIRPSERRQRWPKVTTPTIQFQNYYYIAKFLIKSYYACNYLSAYSSYSFYYFLSKTSASLSTYSESYTYIVSKSNWALFSIFRILNSNTKN